MSLFESRSSQQILQRYFTSLPNKGFGQLSKAAKAMQTHPSALTAVLQGERLLTLEQGAGFATFAGFSELETDYLLGLLQWERAGTKTLKARFERQIAAIAAKSELIKDRLPPTKELSESIKAQFYSDWFYSATRILASLPSMRHSEDFARRLGIPRATVTLVLEFLLTNGLIVKKNERYEVAENSTHIGAGEVLVGRHHANWRLQGLQRITRNPKQGLFFTSPLSISKKDEKKVRELLRETLEKIFDIVDETDPEEAYCINIDWFSFSACED